MSELITIATFHFPTRAHILKTRLSAEGIHVFLKNELHAQVNNFQSQAIGGVQVQVLQKDLERALEITKEFGIDNDYKPSFTDKLILRAYKIGESIKFFSDKPPLERFLRVVGIIFITIAIAALIFSFLLDRSSNKNSFQRSVHSIINETVWCLDSVKYKGQRIAIGTTGARLIMTNCNEELEFGQNDIITFPGFYSREASGRYLISEKYLVIDYIDINDSILNGIYSFSYQKPSLVLKSRTTEIYCRESKRNRILPGL